MFVMKKILFTVFAGICLISCVDENYDLNKLNGEMHFFEKEGLNLSFTDAAPVDLDIFGGGRLSKDHLVVRSESIIEDIDFSQYEIVELERGIKVDGEFQLDLSSFPAFLHSTSNEIRFKDGTRFSIDMTNSVSVPITISFDVYDGKKKYRLGSVKDINVPAGGYGELDILLNNLGMSYIPEEVIIKNIVLKAVDIKAPVSGTLKFQAAEFYMDPVIGKDTELIYNYDFMKVISYIFSDKVDWDAINKYLKITSFSIGVNFFLDLPVHMEAITEGGVTVSVIVDGPLPEGGSTRVIDVKCPEGLGSIAKSSLNISHVLKEDIDLLSLGQRNLSVVPVSLKFEEGIIVEL